VSVEGGLTFHSFFIKFVYPSPSIQHISAKDSLQSLPTFPFDLFELA
jgi:hypothetical protein